MAWPLIGSEGSVGSWGSTNFYSTLLTALSPNSAIVNVTSDSQDITELATFTVAELPGLLFGSATISGFAGASPALGNNGGIAYSAGGYALHVYRSSVRMFTPTVHDITAMNTGSPPTVRAFRPDIFQIGGEYTAGIDSGTALVLPNIPGDSLPTLTLTYLSGATLSGPAIIRQVGPSVVRGQKQVATYQWRGTGSWASVGGLFGTRTFGSGANLDPLWSAGGSAAGAMTINMKAASTVKKVDFADSFWTGISLDWEPGAPVKASISVQATGAITVS